MDRAGGIGVDTLNDATPDWLIQPLQVLRRRFQDTNAILGHYSNLKYSIC